MPLEHLDREKEVAITYIIVFVIRYRFTQLSNYCETIKY